VQSSEDITIDLETGMAFISSDNRRRTTRGDFSEQGAIYGYDLAAEHPVLVNLTREFKKPFYPHGIGFFRPADGGRPLLLAVNHTPEGHFVEIFEYDGQSLIHRQSVSGELMHSPNDVAAVDRDKFYVTNDHGSSSRWGKTIEEYLQLARSYVLYYDGTGFRKVAKGLAYANGIQVSADGKTVYVAATVSRAVFVYDRDMETGELTLRQKIDLRTGVDNLEIDAEGNLWLAAHPKLLTFVRYAKDPTQLSPSQVLRIRWRGLGRYDIDYIYSNDGSRLSGSSVAAVYNGRLLIGSVFDPRFLLCRLKK